MPAPLKYRDTFPEELLTLMSEGKLNPQIYAHFGIHKDTFYQWMYDYPEFKDAYHTGKPKCESYWIEWGMKGMRGEVKGFSFQIWIAFMNNKFSWVPGNKQPDSSTTNNINIGNLNVLQNQNNTQLLESIKLLAEKHKDKLELDLITGNPEVIIDVCAETSSKPEQS